MDATERSLLQSTVDGAVADAGTSADASAVTAVDNALVRLGWPEMLQAEPRDAIEVVFGALGRANATATVLDDVLATQLGVEPREDLAVLLPRFATWDAPGRIESGAVHVDGLATARAATATDLLVVCSGGADLRTVMLSRSRVDAEPVRGIDPTGGLHAIRATTDAGDAMPLDPATWDAAVACSRRAIAGQMAGADRAVLDLARTHAVDRVQFGRPIAGFQAVRHRLADALVAIETLDACVCAAWDDPGNETAALAKAVAGRTTRTVTAHCQQVLAGIGFTTDHPFHRYLKRTMALEGLFGSADAITLDLGRRLLATRRVPTLIEL